MTTDVLVRLAIVFGILALLLFSVWFFTTLRARKTASPLSNNATVTIASSSENVTVSAEIASTMAEKVQGLSDRKSLGDDTGMIFMWDTNIQTQFVMRRMEFPLDIIFIRGESDGTGTIVAIAENLPPCPGQNAGCATASAPEPFRYVLEVNAGFSEKQGIAVGETVRIEFESDT